MLLIHLLLEGILLGILLVLACASGIRGGAVGWFIFITRTFRNAALSSG